MKWLKRISWGTSRRELERMFAGQFKAHPTMDAIGVEGNVYGAPTGTVFYFRPAMLGSKLVRVVITYFDMRPPDAEVQALYARAKQDLTTEFGQPMRTVPLDHTDPPEVRQSEMLVWLTKESVLTLSLRLLRDGVPADSSPVGVGYGDRAKDPVSRALA